MSWEDVRKEDASSASQGLKRFFSMLCAYPENGEGPLLRVAIMPNDLNMLFSCFTSHTWIDLRKHL